MSTRMEHTTERWLAANLLARLLPVQLPGCMVVWLPDYLAAWFSWRLFARLLGNVIAGWEHSRVFTWAVTWEVSWDVAWGLTWAFTWDFTWDFASEFPLEFPFRAHFCFSNLGST